MNGAPDRTHDSSIADTIAEIDAEIGRLQAEREALSAVAAPTRDSDPGGRQALAARLFGVVLPSGTEGAQVAAFAQTVERFDDLAGELAALGVNPQPQGWRSGGIERRAVEWTLAGVSYSLHTPRVPAAPAARFAR
ncbi:MAG: hypothetical protein LC798_12065 [Chloroflexi bacterium]|nr:hypothetical protein [Chloroflexota bacterium]